MSIDMVRGSGEAERPAGRSSSCAACKHQRKGCPKDCLLRRHFPGNMENEFKSIHKVFGIANISRMIKKHNSEEDRDEVARSLLWEAKTWIDDPVRGPYGLFKTQQDELTLCREYIQRLRQERQGVAQPRMQVPNGLVNAIDHNVASNYPGSMMNFNYNGSSNSAVIKTENSLQYPFNGGVEIGQGGIRTQEVQPRSVFPSEGNGRRQLCNPTSSRQSVRDNSLWNGHQQTMQIPGSSVSGNQFVGAQNSGTPIDVSSQPTIVPEGAIRQQNCMRSNYSHIPRSG